MRYSEPSTPRRWASLLSRSSPSKNTNKTHNFKTAPSTKSTPFPPSPPQNTSSGTRITSKPKITTTLSTSTAMVVPSSRHSKRKAPSQRKRHSIFSGSSSRPLKFLTGTISCTETSSLRIFCSVMGGSSWQILGSARG